MRLKLKTIVRAVLPRSIKRHRIQAGPLKGYQLVTSWYDYPAAILGYTERPLLDWFGRNVQAGETWLDVGAHYGYTAIALSELVGSRGRVFAFEPMLSTAGCLARTRLLNGLPQLTVVPFALGAPETLSLEQLPIVRGMIDSTRSIDARQETIAVASLDWLWARIRGESSVIHGIKIDVQGMEVEALLGMCELLTLYKPKLVVEVHGTIVRNQLLDSIEAAGYQRTGVPIEPLPGETEPMYIDDRSYFWGA